MVAFWYNKVFSLALTWTGAAVLTALLHEFGHWVAGTVFGNEMVMSLNTVHVVGSYAAPWQAAVVTAAGPAVTLFQEVLVYALLRRGGRAWLYPFLLTPLVYRAMAMSMNVINPNDEGRLSELLGLNMFVLPALICGILFWLAFDISRKNDFGWKRNVIGALVLVHLLGALILLDQSFSIRLL